MALRIRELDFDAQRASLDGKKADVDVAVLEGFGRLVVRVHKDARLLVVVAAVAVPFARLFNVLRDEDAQVFAEKGCLGTLRLLFARAALF